MSKLISLTKGAYAVVDDDDYEALVAAGSWHMSDTGYAVARRLVNGVKKTIRMHRLIMNAPSDKVVDHLNHDRLDNRKANLRLCSQLENSRNRKHTRGYCWDKSRRKWLVKYKAQYYGRYDTEEEAARAYRLASSGVPKSSQAHYRRSYLPKGVCFMRSVGKYYLRISKKGKRKFYGYYKTVDEAVDSLNKIIKEGG